MKWNVKKTFAVPVAITLLVSGSQFYTTMTSSALANETSSPSTTSAEIGTTGVTLTRQPNGAVTIQAAPNVDSGLRNNGLFFPNDTYVIKIDNTLAKGKSIEDLERLLQGAVGTTVPVLLLQGDVSGVKPLKRYSDEELKGNKRNATESVFPFQVSDLYQNSRGNNSGAIYQVRSEVRATDHFSSSFELGQRYFITNAASIAATTPLPFHFQGFYDDYTSCLGEALIYFAQTGMLNRFDATVELVMDASKQKVLSLTSAQFLALLKCADILAKYNLVSPAKTLLQRLDSIKNKFGTDGAVCYAISRMYIAVASGNANESMADAETLEELCVASKTYITDAQRAALKMVADYALNHNANELAIKALQKLNDYPSKTPAWVKVPRSAEQLQTTATLAKAYASTKPDKAIEVLKQLLADCTEKLTRDDITTFNRLYDTCPASVNFWLASLSVQTGNYADAKGYFDQGARYWSQDIGDDATVEGNIKKINTLFGANSKLDGVKPELSNVLAKLPSALPTNVVTNLQNEDSQYYSKTRQFYDLVAGKKIQPVIKMLDQELQIESAKSKHQTLDVIRLANLVSGCAPLIGQQKALVYFGQLDKLFNESQETREPAAFYVKATEIAYCDLSSNAWENFDNYLSNVAKDYGRGVRDLDNPDTRKHDLLTIAYAYAIANDLLTARKFISYLHSKYPTVAESSNELSAFECVIFCLLGDQQNAEKALLRLTDLNSKGRINSPLQATVAATYLRTKDRNRALSALGGSSTNTFAKAQLDYYKALCLYILGDFKEAAALVGGDPSFGVSGVYEYRRLCGELQIKLGNIDKGIKLISESGENGNDMDAFKRAVDLAESSQKVSNETLENLLDRSTRVRNRNQFSSPDDPTNFEIVETLKRLIKITNTHGCNQSKIKMVQDRLDLIIPRTFSTPSNIFLPIASSPIAAAPNQEQGEIKPKSCLELAQTGQKLIAEGQYQKGADFILQALRAHDADRFGMYHYGNLKGDVCYEAMVKAGQFDLLRKILDQAILTRTAADQKLQEKQKTFAKLERTLLAELLIEQNKFEEAEKLTTEIYKTTAEKKSWCEATFNQAYTSQELNLRMIHQLVEKKQFDTALSLLNKLDKILAPQVGPKHPFWIENKATRAELFQAQNKLDDAEQNAKSAYDLGVWLFGTKYGSMHARNVYASILRQENKKDAADAIENVPIVSERFDESRVFASTGWPVREPRQFSADAEGPLKDLLEKQISLLGRCDNITLKTFDELTRFYSEHQQWQDAEDVQKRKLSIYDETYGSCATPKVFCFLALADIFKSKSDKASTTKYVTQIQNLQQTHEKILAFDDGRMRFDLWHFDQMRFAQILLYVGKKEAAIKEAHEVEEYLTKGPLRFGAHSDNNHTWLFDACTEFMTTVGLTGDVDALKQARVKWYGPERTKPTTRTSNIDDANAAAARQKREETRQQEQKAALDAGRHELDEASANKDAEPRKYFQLLMQMLRLTTRQQPGQTNDLAPYDKLYDEALDFYTKHSTRIDNDASTSENLKELWNMTKMISPKAFSEVFEKLCKLDDSKCQGEHFSDGPMFEVLHDSRREIRQSEVRQLLQKAIDIRKSDLGAKSSTLTSLYVRMSFCCEHLGDTAAAEAFRQSACDVATKPDTQVFEWMQMSEFYGRIKKPDQQDIAWQKALSISKKNNFALHIGSWKRLIEDLQQRHSPGAELIISSILANPSTNGLSDLDEFLLSEINEFEKQHDFRRAAALINQRLASTKAAVSTRTKASDWQLRLSQVYLEQGNEKESQALFDEVLSDLSKQGIPTDEVKKSRAVFLERLGKHGQAHQIEKQIPVQKGKIILAAPLMVKQSISFGHNDTFNLFDSTKAPSLRNSRLFSFATPIEVYNLNRAAVSGPIIICQGVVSHSSSNLLLAGPIACRQSDFGPKRGFITDVPLGTLINDAPPPPNNAVKLLSKSSPLTRDTNGGDFIANAIPSNMSFEPKNLQSPVRIFIEDDNDGKDLVTPSFLGRNVSGAELQIFYNGTRTINASGFSGLLYAPHATVKIGFNGTFRGALVASTLILEGNNNIDLDLNCVGIEFGK